MRIESAVALALLLPSLAIALPPIGMQGAIGSRTACNPLRANWAPQSANLQSVWHFDGPTGSTSVADSISGNTANATYAIQPDHIGNASLLNNPNAQGLATTNSMTTPSVFTYTAWFKTTSVAGGAIFDFTNSQTGSPTAYDRILTMNTTGQMMFSVFGGGSNAITSPAAYNDGNWHHVAAVFDNASEFLYIDGSLVTSLATGAAGGSYTGYFRIGTSVTASWSGYPASTQFDGLIDEAGIWSTNLSASTIAALAASMSEVNSSHPQWANTYGIYHFTESTGNFVDASGHGNDAIPIQARPALAPGIFGTAMVGAAGFSSAFTTTTQYSNPQTFSLMAWFRTTSSSGGVMIELAAEQTGAPNNYDRFLAMENNGTVMFGVNGSVTVLRSASGYNDGKWHLAIATMIANAQVLYIDGFPVATASASGAESYSGYWRLASGRLDGWPVTASGSQYSGELDEVAWWNSVLTPTDVRTILNGERCGVN